LKHGEFFLRKWEHNYYGNKQNRNKSKKDMKANSEHEDKQTGTLNLDKSCTRSSIRQK